MLIESLKRRFFIQEEILFNFLRRHPAYQSIPYWISAILTGFIAVFYAKAFRWAELLSAKLIQEHPYLFLIITPVVFLLGWMLVYFFSKPASGSGIPQILAAGDLNTHIESKTLKSLLGIKMIFVKIFSSLLCVFAGGAIGREGPTIQVSAAVFFNVCKRFRVIWPDFNHQSWIIAGGAAGLAAAFNTPLGGIVYAIEELCTISFHRFKVVFISSVMIAGLVAQWLLGPYLYFGFPKILPIDMRVLPYTALIGLVTGLLGALFGKILSIIAIKRIRIKNFWKLALFALFTGVLVSVIFVFLDPHARGSGHESILNLLFEDEGIADWKWVIGRFFSSILSYASGCAGGIFAPSLSIGAAIGSTFSSYLIADHNKLFVLLGMIGFLSAVTRAPFTSFVLVLEMTDRHSAIFPMMFVALISISIARVVDKKSFYERLHIFYSYLMAKEARFGKL